MKCNKCNKTQTTLNKFGVENWYNSKEGKICSKCYQRERNISTKLLIFKRYSNGKMSCICCGEHRVEFLTLDHKNGRGNKHRKLISKKTGMAFYRWLKQNNYPSDYQILCWNCNCSNGIFGYCPHIR